jgi:hypothetical protein
MHTGRIVECKPHFVQNSQGKIEKEKDSILAHLKTLAPKVGRAVSHASKEKRQDDRC